jgi:AcrR family transcriptional regulator
MTAELDDETGSPLSLEGAPSQTTRERILDVALDLFARKGYAGTSLREIAAELGFSKAALYYHFPSKQDILLGLHERMHGTAKELALDLRSDEPDAWPRILEQLTRIALRNRTLLELHFREREAVAALHEGQALVRHGELGNDMEQYVLGFIADTSAPIETRVRRVASLGAVVGMFLASGALTDISDADLERMIRTVLKNVLEPGG